MHSFLRLVVFFITFTSASVFAAEKVAVIKKTYHTCRIAANTCTPLKSGDAVYEGDIIQTDKDGFAGLSFIDGTTVALDKKSKFRIEKYNFIPLKKSYSFDVLLSRGAALYTSGRLGKLAPQAVNFKTPSTVIAVRGTRFLVSVE